MPQIDADKFAAAFMAALPDAHADVADARASVGAPAMSNPLAGKNFCDIIDTAEKAINAEMWIIKLFAPTIAMYITAIEAGLDASVKPILCPAKAAPASTSEPAPTGGGRKPGKD